MGTYAENKGLVFQNISELVNYNTTNLPSPIVASTLGYYVSKDGGHGTYEWVNDQNNTNNGSKIKSAFSGSWRLISNSYNFVNVLQWGAKNDGMTDASPRINEAITETSIFSGTREIYIPPGVYAVGSTINVAQNNTRIKLHGTLRNISGVNSTVLEVYTRKNPVITQGVPSYQLSNIVIDGENIGSIDQNSQNATPWDANNPYATKTSHALFVFNTNGVTVKDLTVRNSIIWSIAIELCKSVSVSGCKVYTGFCNNRLVNGVRKYLGTQDGIHAVDCVDTIITHNYVESGDDSIIISATRSFAKNGIVSNNNCQTKVFAYEPDGSLNNNSVAGRFPLAVYCESISEYCGLENVIVSNNIIPGGQGLFGIYDIDKRTDLSKPRQGNLNCVKFLGNSFSNINSPGNPAVQPLPVEMGWIIQGGDNIEFIGNTFNNIARWGNINYGKNGTTNVQTGTISFRHNKFYNFKAPPTNQFAGQTPAIIWLARSKTTLIIENNTFENNSIAAIAVSGTGDFTPNLFDCVSVNDNRFINNKTCMECFGADVVLFNNNYIKASSAPVLKVRVFNVAQYNSNTIIGVKNGCFSPASNAFSVLSNTPVQLNSGTNYIFDSATV